MQVKEIDFNTGKIQGNGICKKKYLISFLGGPTTPTYSKSMWSVYCHDKLRTKYSSISELKVVKWSYVMVSHSRKK